MEYQVKNFDNLLNEYVLEEGVIDQLKKLPDIIKRKWGDKAYDSFTSKLIDQGIKVAHEIILKPGILIKS